MNFDPTKLNLLRGRCSLSELYVRIDEAIAAHDQTKSVKTRYFVFVKPEGKAYPASGFMKFCYLLKRLPSRVFVESRSVLSAFNGPEDWFLKSCEYILSNPRVRYYSSGAESSIAIKSEVDDTALFPAGQYDLILFDPAGPESQWEVDYGKPRRRQLAMSDASNFLKTIVFKLEEFKWKFIIVKFRPYVFKSDLETFLNYMNQFKFLGVMTNGLRLQLECFLVYENKPGEDDVNSVVYNIDRYLSFYTYLARNDVERCNTQEEIFSFLKDCFPGTKLSTRAEGKQWAKTTPRVYRVTSEHHLFNSTRGDAVNL